MVMRQLRARELTAARDWLGDAFIVALIVAALFWSPQLRQRVDERDYLIRTIAFEASEEPEFGQVAVAYVVLNRKNSGRWGDNIKAVVTHPGQFEPWMTRRKEIETLSQDDPRYRRAAIIADAVLSGRTPDPTAGATHFLNPTIVRERRGGSLPPWALGEGRPIGRHIFYVPETSPQLAPLISGSIGGSLGITPTP
jgi:spore germination cell wall hydrolase CwlJ-like protein